MFITFREKSITELIVRTSGKHTVHSLATYLNVSGRTIQRDLKSVEKLLAQFDLVIKRNASEGLFIDGNNDQIYRLVQNLISVNPTDETPEERKLSLLIILLHEGPSFKKQVLANQMGISPATLTTYLDDLTEWLHKFSIKLSRRRGVGVEVEGQEAHKRHALANYFLVHFYEELVESLYFLQQGKNKEEKILEYFRPAYLAAIDRLVNKHINQKQTRLADSDYVALVVHSCLTLQRTAQQFLLATVSEPDKFSNEHQLIAIIAKELNSQLAIQLTAEDIEFLAMILKGSKVQAADMVYYDSVLLGKLIKSLVADVSSQLHVNLNDDFSLYQGLLAHMGPSIFRLKQNLESFNPLTEEIKGKYPVLFMAVKQGLENGFSDIGFPADEIAYVVLHFGSALMMNEEKVRIDAVVICPTGIGTSKMLASRIQKELAEINSVEILSINDFQSGNLRKYDLVVSTIRLPVTDVDYIMVSPLLSDKDILSIESYLQHNVEKITRKKEYGGVGKPAQSRRLIDKPNVRELLREIKEVQESMDTILANFSVRNETHATDHRQVLAAILAQAETDGLVESAKAAMHHLDEREAIGGLGIPNTNMALFHCRAETVQELVFQVVHLDAACPVKGMDGGQVQMRNLLLMLAPLDMTDREQEILSLISSSLIESDEALMIYSSSNESLIRNKLEDVFYEYLQNNLIKG